MNVLNRYGASTVPYRVGNILSCTHAVHIGLYLYCPCTYGMYMAVQQSIPNGLTYRSDSSLESSSASLPVGFSGSVEGNRDLPG